MASQEASGETPKRFRRQPGLGRELILTAAHDEFCDHGYARATTRGIAERAGVAEALLFRHFGSKAALFNEVVFGPMRAFMLEWEKFDALAGDEYDAEAFAKKFVGGLYDLLRANRGLMVTYFATQVFEPEVLDQPGNIPAFLEVIRMMDRMTEKRAVTNTRPGRRTKASAQIRVHERINVGSVIAAALFDDLLFAALPTRPARNQIVNELARIAVASLPVIQG
jgi:AcrR family transcriptional regulator